MPSNDLHYAVIHLFVGNRIGLVEKLARFVFEHGGSIVDDVARALGSEAVVFMLIEGNEQQLETMELHLPQLRAALEAPVILKRTNHVILPAGQRAERFRFQVTSEDFSGLLARLMALCVKHRLDVTLHEGERYVPPAAKSKLQYIQRFEVLAPAVRMWTEFKQEMNKLRDELQGEGVSFDWSPFT